MGKNKKDKKGKGAEKTARKTEARVSKKQKRVLDAAGEDNVEALIAQFQADDKRRTEINEMVCSAPSPRSSFTFTTHSEHGEVLLFGGEYFDGSKTYLYNDLFVLRVIDKNCDIASAALPQVEWRQVTSPCQPPPRCSHQAVMLQSGPGGSLELWLFGGEFSSPSQSQFYHYKDMWKMAVRSRRWEQVRLNGAQPTARSGHRMIACRQRLLLFGGFVDTGSCCRYLQDLWQFDPNIGQWTVLLAADNNAPWPPPRSACLAIPLIGSFRAGGGAPCVLIQGGYFKEQIKKEVERGHVYTDAWTLQLVTATDGISVAARWQSCKTSGNRPSPRTSASLVALSPDSGTPSRGYVFGGVFDRVETDEDVEGVFFDDLHMIDLERMRWQEIEYRGFSSGAAVERKRPRRRKDKHTIEVDDDVNNEEEEETEDMEIDSVVTEVNKVQLNNIFTVTVAADKSDLMDSTDVTMKKKFMTMPPSARMNAGIVVLGNTLLLYGGIMEKGERQITCDDLHRLDLLRLEGWCCLQPGTMSQQLWHGVDSSASEDEMEFAKEALVDATAEIKPSYNSDEDSDDSDDELDAPSVNDGENCDVYFVRTQEFWLDYIRSQVTEEGLRISERRLLKYAKNTCSAAYIKITSPDDD